MAMNEMTYQAAREHMMPGDVIAFGGSGAVSGTIKMLTRSTVSHVGIILQTQVRDDHDPNRYLNQIIEATGDGVQIYSARKRVLDYHGDVWWLPLDRQKPFNQGQFYQYLLDQQGKEYDMKQAVQAGTDVFDSLGSGALGYAKEDLSRFFCSELVAEGLQRSGMLGQGVNINSSEVTPIDLCRWRIYKQDYTLLMDANQSHPKVSRFNTADPLDWVA